MERGLDNMTDSTGLCLQDLVGGGNGTGGNNNSGGGGGNNNANNGSNNTDHLHNHHSLHDSVSSAVSVSSAITSLMTPSSIGTGLSHLHHHGAHATATDVGAITHHHHPSLGSHTSSVLHEPLEKLKCKLNFLCIGCVFYLLILFTSINSL